jgi:hypothetical protein
MGMTVLLRLVLFKVSSLVIVVESRVYSTDHDGRNEDVSRKSKLMLIFQSTFRTKCYIYVGHPVLTPFGRLMFWFSRHPLTSDMFRINMPRKIVVSFFLATLHSREKVKLHYSLSFCVHLLLLLLLRCCWVMSVVHCTLCWCLSFPFTQHFLELFQPKVTEISAPPTYLGLPDLLYT